MICAKESKGFSYLGHHGLSFLWGQKISFLAGFRFLLGRLDQLFFNIFHCQHRCRMLIHVMQEEIKQEKKLMFVVYLSSFYWLKLGMVEFR